MGKFHGEVGYNNGTVQTPPESGVWVEEIVERTYFGDVVKNRRNLEAADNLNDNISVANLISIVADEYARNHFHAIRYVRWQGSNWKVSSVEVEHPRLLLTIGDIYNGPTAG